MRLGPLEIILIIAIIIGLVIIARVFRTGKSADKQSDDPYKEIPHWRNEGKTDGIRRNLRKVGIAGVIAGVVLALAGLSLFRWAVQSYVWALIIVLMGLAFIILSRKQ